MSSDVLERMLEDQHEVRMIYISPLDPDCKRVIEDAARTVARKLNEAGWQRGERAECLRGESLTKTEGVSVHPLDPPNTGAGKGRRAFAVTKLGKLYSRRGRDRHWQPVRLQGMDLMERKHLEILLGLNLRSC